MFEHTLALSFDSTTSPGLQIRSDFLAQQNITSWGFSWYPSTSGAVSTLKGGQESSIKSIANSLNDWDRFRSTTFLCQLSNIEHYTEHENIQPCCRNVQGKDWAWTATGLSREAGTDLTSDDDFYRPVGSSLAEICFCDFLNEFFIMQSSTLQDVNWHDVYQYFENHAVYDAGNVTLTDGQIIIHYRGRKAKQKSYLLRRTPPHADHLVQNEFMAIDIVNSSDPYRTVLCLSTRPFEKADNQLIACGGMVVLKRGSVRFERNARINTNLTALPHQSTAVTTLDQFTTNKDGAKKYFTNVRSMVKTEDGKSLGYRILKVRHQTRYEYEKPNRHSTHVFRLTPVEDDIQEVISSTLSLSAGGTPIFYEDAFGNKAAHLTIEEPYREFTVTMETAVKIYDRPPDDFSSPLRQSNIPLLWMPWQRQMMLPYLLPAELPESQLAELSEFAMSFVERNDYDLVKTLNDINGMIFRDFDYVTGSTSNKSTAFDVYSTRKGVCQDFANLFICLARILSIPARYRTGYIYTGGNYENKIQSDASHAWLEVYLPYLGWRGFDPTNGCIVTQDHIRIACGRNFRDATPTTGTIYQGGGGLETLSVDVKVTEG